MSDSPPNSKPENSEDPIVPTSFVFEVVERANDRLLDRLDALDGFFGIMMTAVLAVVLLALERSRVIGWYADVSLGWIAIACLAGAFACAIIGWWPANAPWGPSSKKERDAPVPHRFVWGVGKRGEKAITDAIKAILESYNYNLPIRAHKRRFAAITLGLLTLGTLAAGLAKVV